MNRLLLALVPLLLFACGDDAPDKRNRKVSNNETNNTSTNNVSTNNNTSTNNVSTNNNTNNITELCGNGDLDPGEVCDPAGAGSERCPTECPQAPTCSTISLIGQAEECTARCEVRPVGCVNDDGCCSVGCNSSNDNDCMNVCGNDIVEENETCDGNCPTSCDDGNACTVDSFTGSAENCSIVCTHTPRTMCASNDGCCPAGCTSANDNDCSSSCGNNIIEANETCDGNCPTSCNDNNTCTIDTLTGSAATCNAMCSSTQITSCQNGDGCCPAGCISSNDNDCACNPTTSCQAQALNCGTIFNGCQTVSCGTCGTNQVCDNNRCVAANPVGNACTSDAQCGAGFECAVQNLTGFTGGYCTKACDSDFECGAGAHCTTTDGTGFCVKSCASNAQCTRTSYECFDGDQRGRNECWPIGSGTRAIGQPCTHVGECSGGQLAECILQSSGFFQGYCTAECNTNNDCGNTNLYQCYRSNPGNVKGICLANTCNRTGYLIFDANDDGRTECFPAATGSTPVGGACANQWDCSGGEYGSCFNGAAGGYCTVNCGANGTSCPFGSVCWQNSACVKNCTVDTECRTNVGYFCAYDSAENLNFCWY